MPNLYDIGYALGVGLAAPFWLARTKARRKVLKAFRERMGWGIARRGSGPAVMIHAVSLGEMNATRALIRTLAAARTDLHFIVSSTTDTGHARGIELYRGDGKVTLIRYPLDFSAAVRRVLGSARPDVVVLMELEVWPNFIRHCTRAGVPVLVVNGRLTPSSFRNYTWARPLVAPTFRRLRAVRAQEQAYADRFIALGTPPERVRVTGTMKFDTAEVGDRIEGDARLAEAVGLRPGQGPVWVCGSTGPGEEQIVLRVYRSLLDIYPRLRLVIVPRHPQRFDETAALIVRQGFALVRRSRPAGSEASDPRSETPPPVVLGDSMGDLRKFYSFATVVFVGRTLIDLGDKQHGSDMIEPAALAKPVVVGPFTHNFAEPMNRLRAADAVRVVKDEPTLRAAIHALLCAPAEAATMGRRAQELVRREQGATARHAEVILEHLPTPDAAAPTPAGVP